MDQKINKLKEYIETRLDEGNTEDVIKDALQAAGWPQKYVDKAFSMITGKPRTIKKPHKPHHVAYRAEDIMDKEVNTAHKDINVKEILEDLHQKDTGYVLIMEKKRPIGIITGSDIVRHLDANGSIDVKMNCSRIMTSPLYYVNHTDSILDVCEKMKERCIERIPVFRKGKLVGIITAYSLINFMSYG